MKRSEARSLPAAELSVLWERQPCIQLAEIIPKEVTLGLRSEGDGNTREEIEDAEGTLRENFTAEVAYQLSLEE